MSYVAKTDWKHSDPISENDLNRIENGIKTANDKYSLTSTTGDVKSTASNLNMSAEVGVFLVGSNATGAPTTAVGLLYVWRRGATHLLQEYWEVSSNIRHHRTSSNNGSTWSTWSTLATTALATQSANGLQSAADKTALDNAQKWKLTENNGTVVTPVNNTNFDTILLSGMYRYVVDLGHSGSPGGNYYTVLVQGFNTTTSTQLWIATNTENMFVRRYEGGSWKPFRRISDDYSLTNALMGNKFTAQSNANFIGKVSGSTSMNPHFGGRRTAIGLGDPTNNGLWVEYGDVGGNSYSRIQQIDNSVSSTITTLLNGSQAQEKFSFNLIAHVERTYGTIPGTTTADKVAWLKINIKSYLFRWHGHGSSPSGSKAYLQRWIPHTSSWFGSSAHTGSTAQRIETGASNGNEIDSNGFVHAIAYADPSDGTTASIINTDYVELQVELSTDIKTNILLGGVQGHKLTQDNGDALAPASDADLINKSGLYRVSATTANVPNNANNGTIFHMERDSRPTQLFFRYEDQTNYVRHRQSSGWTQWKRFVDGNMLINSLMGNSVTDQSNANFIGKVAGNTTANPHIASQRNSVGLETVNSSAFEFADARYQVIVSADGMTTSTSTTVSGEQPKHRFSFNLISHVERTYGAIPGATTADKAVWLRVNISRLTFNWWGSGSSPAGNKASFALWDVAGVWNATVSHANASVQRLSIASTQTSLRIDSNGFVHALAYADPSDGTTASAINTDYVELIVDLDTSLKKNLAPTWIDAVLQNGWVEFDSGRKPRYSQGVDGYVFLRGAVRLGTLGSSTPIMTLPTGFRPLNSFAFSAIAGISTNMLATIQVNAAGQVSVISQGSTDNAYISLDNVRFPTN